MGVSENERWTAAEVRATTSLSAKQHRESRRRWVLLIIFASAVGVGSTFISTQLFEDERSVVGSAEPPALVWPAIVVAGVGALIAITGLLAGAATRRLLPDWESVEGALSRAQRRAVHRQIRGRESVDIRHVVVLRETAKESAERMVGLIPVFIGAVIMILGSIVAIDLPEMTLVLVAMLLIVLAVAIFTYGRMLPATRRFLRRPEILDPDSSRT